MQIKNNQVIVISIICSLITGAIGAYGTLRYERFRDNGKINYSSEGSAASENLVEESIIQVAKDVSPSVVSIIATKEVTVYQQDPFSFFFNDNNFFGMPFGGQKNNSKSVTKEQKSGGSGFIITKDGLVVTNKHVVTDDSAEYTVITNDGEKFKAEIVSKDPIDDFAVIKIKDATKDFTPVTIGDSDQIEIGQFVVAIGNALAEFQNTVTFGVISAKSRSLVAGDSQGQGAEQLSGLFQTDAAINPGNSGGPLVNLKGEVVGINTAIATNAQNIGFAIPINKLKGSLKSIEKNGKIIRPYLGVYYKVLDDETSKKFNLSVSEGAWLTDDVQNGVPAIIKDSPAAKAGLKAGDIITKINDDKITSDNPLVSLVGEYGPDDKIKLEVIRDGKTLTVDVTLGNRDSAPKEEAQEKEKR